MTFKQTQTTTIAAVALVALVAAGCGGRGASSGNTTEVSPAGDIPDNQAFVPFTPPRGGYTVKVPEGWAQTGKGRATTFTDKLNSITVEAAPARAAMTVSEARQAAPARPAHVDTVRRSAGQAVRTKYLATSKPDPVTGKVTKDAVERYVFFHNGRRVVLTLSGPNGADNVDPWKIVSDSLRWTR